LHTNFAQKTKTKGFSGDLVIETFGFENNFIPVPVPAMLMMA